MVGALHGVRILDLSTNVSGPFATGILGDMGADVIKLEEPGDGDIGRRFGPMREGIAASFTVMNRNKRGAAIDLHAEGGRELFLRLVKTADVIIQNFRPGVVDRIGIGYDACRAVKDDIIYVSISGYGETGPLSKDRVYDPVIQAVSGFMGVQADPVTGMPIPVRHIVCDKAAAMTVAQGVLAALFARERGNGGQHVKVAMLDAGLAYLWSDAMSNYTYVGTPHLPEISALLNVAKTLDGYITFIFISDNEFQGLCRALSLPELAANPEYAEPVGRMPNMPEISKIAGAEIAKLTTADIVARFAEEQVPCARINLRADLLNDPQIVHNKLLIETDDPVMGRVRFPRPAIQFSKTPSSVRSMAPQVGAHNDEVFTEIGVSADELATLKAKGVFG